MVKVRRANVILDIEDDADNIQRYLDKGYSVVDAVTEEVIQEAIPHDVGALRAMVIQQQNTIEQLEAEIANLKADKPKVTRTRKTKN